LKDLPLLGFWLKIINVPFPDKKTQTKYTSSRRGKARGWKEVPEF